MIFMNARIWYRRKFRLTRSKPIVRPSIILIGPRFMNLALIFKDNAFAFKNMSSMFKTLLTSQLETSLLKLDVLQTWMTYQSYWKHPKKINRCRNLLSIEHVICKKVTLDTFQPDKSLVKFVAQKTSNSCQQHLIHPVRNISCKVRCLVKHCSHPCNVRYIPT